MISLRVLLATMPIGLFFVLRPHSVLAFWTDLDVISFNNMNDSGPVVYDLRVKRISRKEFGISGNVIIGDYQPMQCGARAYFSAKADNQYTLLPLKVAPKACCEQVNDFYVKYVMKDLANFSDLPQVETTGPEVCDMLKNHNFTVDKYVFDPTPVPKMLQAGMYKVHVLIMDEEQLVAGLEVIVKLS